MADKIIILKEMGCARSGETLEILWETTDYLMVAIHSGRMKMSRKEYGSLYAYVCDSCNGLGCDACNGLGYKKKMHTKEERELIDGLRRELQ